MLSNIPSWQLRRDGRCRFLDFQWKILDVFCQTFYKAPRSPWMILWLDWLFLCIRKNYLLYKSTLCNNWKVRLGFFFSKSTSILRNGYLFFYYFFGKFGENISQFWKVNKINNKKTICLLFYYFDLNKVCWTFFLYDLTINCCQSNLFIPQLDGFDSISFFGQIWMLGKKLLI